MLLRVLTVATDSTEKSEIQLIAESAGQAVIALAETPYYESLEKAMKIRRYVKQKNVPELPVSMQEIIRKQQGEAGKYEMSAASQLAEAIMTGQYYVDGEKVSIKPSPVTLSKKDEESREHYEIRVLNARAKTVLDQALELFRTLL